MPEYPCTGPVTVTLRSDAGNVHVIAEDRSTVSVDVQPGAMGEAARSAAASTQIEMTGDQLLVETPHARGFMIRRTPAVNISIRVPQDSRLNLRTASADLVCDGRFADVEVRSASGDLRIDHVSGYLERSTASGDTRFGRVDGDLRCVGASADLRGEQIGGDLTSRAVSGDVNIGAVGGSVRIDTASGDARIGSLSSGTARINAVSGDVVIGVVEGTAVWLDLSTVSGDTRSELAVETEAPQGTEAGLTLHVRTVSGDISIQRSSGRTARATQVPQAT